jgi:TIR domain/Domain of unknown function (DUF4384)
MGNIFISYRRGDSIATAGRIRDRLVQAFGRKRVFVDVDDIPHGQDFVTILQSKVAECDVLLAIIGPAWLDARDEKGRRRLDDPEDFVAIEVGSALARDKTAVIPVLVDGAKMPTAAELPDALKPLARRNAIELRNTQFGSDADRLVKTLTPTMSGGTGTSPSKIAAAIAGILLLGIGGWAAWPSLQAMLSTKPAPVSTQVPASISVQATPASTSPDIKASIGRLSEVMRAADGSVTVKLRGGNSVKLGNEIVFEVTSTIPGKLILIDISATGEVVQIFPNTFVQTDQAQRLQKNTTIPIPGPGYGLSGFKAVEPVGRGTLIALVQPDTVTGTLPIITAQATKGFQPVAAPNTYFDELLRYVTGAAKGSAMADGWGFARVEYEIVQ